MSEHSGPALTHRVVAHFAIPEWRADAVSVSLENVPAGCERFLCLIVAAEFQEDRLGILRSCTPGSGYHALDVGLLGCRIAAQSSGKADLSLPSLEP